MRRKLALLEGDRKAFFETSQRALSENREAINALRKENKTIAAKLKMLKRPGDAKPAGSQHQLQEAAQSAIQKRNSLRHQLQKKQRKLKEMQNQLQELDLEEAHRGRNSGGTSAEMQRVRALENQLDKANIKAQEAQHIKRTYEQIISQLEKDRLQFDSTISKLEKALESRKQELVHLEAMCNDANAARDKARQALQQREAALAQARKEQEAEKAKLSALAEERRRQYEAMEKRLRLASAGTSGPKQESSGDGEAQEKLESYEDAMRRIRDATGASDVNDVVQRFLSQGETQEHLQRLQRENTEQLDRLREELARKQKQFEALKYSGEARNTGNQRMLAEFEAHLSQAETRCDSAKQASERTQKTLVALSSGIDALYEKLGAIKPVQFRAASSTQDKLIEAELRLKKLHEELAGRKAELPGGLEGDSIPRILPEHNTRVPLNSGDSDDDDDDDLDEDDVVSRDAMKRQAQSMVDAKSNKKRGKRKN
jgi:chromosome segregation ATPase